MHAAPHGRQLSSFVVCTCAAGSHADYQHSISPSTFYSAFLQGLGSKDNFEPVLFNGLRVRMGVVTGDIPSGTSIKNSALFQLAKGNEPLPPRQPLHAPCTTGICEELLSHLTPQPEPQGFVV